jgi:hypothetical protein
LWIFEQGFVGRKKTAELRSAVFVFRILEIRGARIASLLFVAQRFFDRFQNLR